MTASIHSLLLSEVVPTPWKNGGGITRELLAWPSASDWLIRVSVADIEQDGPFSAFPGIDRFFAVLDGEGIELEGVGSIRNGDSPVAFAGNTARQCKLLNGRTRDLNVMIRRDRGHGWLQSCDPEGETFIAPRAAVHGVFSRSAARLVWSDGNTALDIASTSGEALFHFAFWHHETLQT
jgi:uncharacterized protein